MARIIVFDVNETLLDMNALEPKFREIFGDGHSLKEWFSLVLLHAEASTLAGPYFDFAALAGAALEDVDEVMIAGAMMHQMKKTITGERKKQD